MSSMLLPLSWINLHVWPVGDLLKFLSSRTEATGWDEATSSATTSKLEAMEDCEYFVSFPIWSERWSPSSPHWFGCLSQHDSPSRALLSSHSPTSTHHHQPGCHNLVCNMFRSHKRRPPPPWSSSLGLQSITLEGKSSSIAPMFVWQLKVWKARVCVVYCGIDEFKCFETYETGACPRKLWLHLLHAESLLKSGFVASLCRTAQNPISLSIAG